ncbi:DUF4345 family protein [Aurantimonas sp. VKM B-3413]|uniref:AGROH133_08824 family phage infection protein n=1 Tax=Aurantimonas sp. VKM B-3413 TaxID=2779401 RepID=UPI001E65D672|nr:DUF4345 family protein [Aurantimonas sp. VKM B-3413]MCB8839694.1 DUF4345 family protein [Aurantimonas sp. VKM B-3413]
MDFALPTTNAGWLPFAAGCVTIFFGLCALFAPGLTMRALGVAPSAGRADAYAAARANLAGFWLGVGIVAAALYDQPFVQLALGAGWIFSAFGRFVSFLSDGRSAFGVIAFLVELALAAAALAPAFGFISN